MRDFKVNKSIEKRPVLFGLELEAFRIFGSITSVVILIVLFAFSIAMLIFAAIVVPTAWILSSWLFDKKFIKNFSDDQLPQQVKNNL